MSVKKKPDALPPFVGKDGEGTEVWVQRGKGVIENLSFKSEKKVADVHIIVEGFTYPVHGWIQVNDVNDPTKKSEIFELVQKAFDSNEPVIYRVESQRKKNVDKSIPIQELRKTTEIAKEKTTPIMASLKLANGDAPTVFSVEAVTDPADDPVLTPGGRVSAMEVNRRNSENGTQANAPVQPNQNAHEPQQAPPRGAYAQVPGSMSAMEGKPWERLNHDGTLNIGSYSVLASGRTEHVVRKELVKAGIPQLDESFAPNPEFNKLVSAYTIIALNIMDKIQQFVTKKNANRLSNSYTRARELVVDTLENVAPISSVEGENATMSRTDWYKVVGKVSMERFMTICRIDSEGSRFNMDDFLSGGDGTTPPEPKPQAPVQGNPQAQSQNHTQNPQNAPVTAQNAPQRPQSANNVPAPQNGAQGAPEATKELTEQDMNNLRPAPRGNIDPSTKVGMDALREMAKPNPNTGTDPALLAEVMAEVQGKKNGAQPVAPAPQNMNEISVYRQSNQKREGENPSKPSNETAGLVKQFVEDYSISLEDLGLVLTKTFGVDMIVEIEEHELAGFIGHYIDQEIDNPGHFQRVINTLKKA